MSEIKVRNLSFSYDGGITDVFDNVSFSIDTSWRLGFVGRNGKGKTTFLKLLLGEYEYRGQIITDTVFTYFPFSVKDRSKTTYEVILEACPDAEDWKIYREINKLNVDSDVLFRPFDSLSGGEQTKTLMAAMFINNDKFLLLDEPTDHLDGLGRKAVSEYLSAKSGFIVVSHDRAFLDGCVDHILAINRTNIEVQNGNFSSFLENFERTQEFERTQNARLKKDIKRLNDAAKRTEAWAQKTEKEKSRSTGDKVMGTRVDKGYVGHKAAKLMQRAKATETRIQAAVEQKSRLLRNTEYSDELKLRPLTTKAERLASFKDVQAIYNDCAVGSPVKFDLMRGDRIALDGKNGCGKSSIVKLLAGAHSEHTGELRISSGLKISYLPQSIGFLCGTLSEFAKDRRIDESLLKTILRKLDFTRDLFNENIGSLSNGQKKKILLAASLCESAHVYVWDEPLNFIDIYSRIQIERLIHEFQPTMVFVEHDDAFRQAVATRVIEL